MQRVGVLWDKNAEKNWLNDYLGHSKKEEKTEIRIEPPKDFQCHCRSRCTSSFCGCRKWGIRCNDTCTCSASSSCKNPLMKIGVLFGDDDFEKDDGGKTRPGGCFAQYLATEAGSYPENIDFEDLRCTLMDAKAASYFKLPENPVFDDDEADYLGEWKATWLRGFISAAEKKAHVQALFRYALGDDNVPSAHPPQSGEESYYDDLRPEKRWFFSFCCNDWMQRDRIWHCRACGKCKGANTWHCKKCKKCRRGLNVPCKRCGGVSDRPEHVETNDGMAIEESNDEEGEDVDTDIEGEDEVDED